MKEKIDLFIQLEQVDTILTVVDSVMKNDELSKECKMKLQCRESVMVGIISRLGKATEEVGNGILESDHV